MQVQPEEQQHRRVKVFNGGQGRAGIGDPRRGGGGGGVQAQ
jgi:hypothetical protein